MVRKPKLYQRLYESVGIEERQMAVKLTQAPPIHNRSSFKVFSGGIVHQADLIYMPEDQGYQFILTCVDVASRYVDAEPLKGRTAEDAIEGFERIYKRKYLKPPKYLYTDNGVEFKNEIFHKYIEGFGTIIRHTMAYRKNQMAVGEYYNHIITKVLGTKMTSEELQHRENNTDWVNSFQHINDWVDALPKLIAELNKDRREQTIGDFMKDPIFKKGEKLLEVGNYVHVRLQVPRDTMTGERLTGKFRHGDQRFDEKVSEIDGVIIRPGQPVRYMVKGINNASFLRSELLLANEREIAIENEKKSRRR